jgi:DNA/RNA endonuclease YhcR with UshA esterase domain
MNLYQRVVRVLAVLATAIVCTAPAAYCQGMGQNGGGRFYNPSTETTVTGTIEDVRSVPGRNGRGWGGTHLDLKTESGKFDVHLGPSAFLAAKHFTFAKGDQVEVTGSKVTYQGHDAIIAREVTAGGKVLTLRNAQGIPEWSGGRRRAQ